MLKNTRTKQLARVENLKRLFAKNNHKNILKNIKDMAPGEGFEPPRAEANWLSRPAHFRSAIPALS